MMKKETITPPLAQKIPYTFELHGEKIEDEYRLQTYSNDI
jgi:protease II